VTHLVSMRLLTLDIYTYVWRGWTGVVGSHRKSNYVLSMTADTFSLSLSLSPIPKSIHLTHKCMIAHFPDLEQALQWNVAEAKLVSWTQTSPLSEIMRSCKCISHMSNIPTLTYNRANNVILKSMMHDIFNLRVTEIVICIISEIYNIKICITL
jgi:hypothetical protein